MQVGGARPPIGHFCQRQPGGVQAVPVLLQMPRVQHSCSNRQGKGNQKRNARMGRTSGDVPRGVATTRSETSTSSTSPFPGFWPVPANTIA